MHIKFVLKFSSAFGHSVHGTETEIAQGVSSEPFARETFAASGRAPPNSSRIELHRVSSADVRTRRNTTKGRCREIVDCLTTPIYSPLPVLGSFLKSQSMSSLVSRLFFSNMFYCLNSTILVLKRLSSI